MAKHITESPSWGDAVYERLNAYSQKFYGKKYDDLPEDGEEQAKVIEAVLLAGFARPEGL